MPRYATYLRIRAGNEQRYREMHASVFPDLKDAMRSAGIRNYSIFVHGREVFSYLECDDLDAVVARLRNDPAEIRWQQATAELTEPSPGGGLELLDEVFHQD
jgi:L-rhamnose mutarotase